MGTTATARMPRPLARTVLQTASRTRRRDQVIWLLEDGVFAELGKPIADERSTFNAEFVESIEGVGSPPPDGTAR